VLFRSEWKLVDRYVDAVLGREVQVIQPIDRDDQNLEMSAGEAYAYGFSRAVVSSEAELKARYGLSQLIRIDVNWSESLAGYLTSPAVRGILPGTSKGEPEIRSPTGRWSPQKVRRERRGAP